MKKVLIFGMTENYAGMENFIINYYRKINRKKIHFDFIVTSKDTIAFEKEILESDSKIYRMGKKRKNFFLYKKNMKKFFSKHAKEYDAIWCNVCHLKNIDYLVYAKKYGIKARILHSHASGINNSEKIFLRYIYRMRQFFNKMRETKYVTDYWACSDEAAEYLFKKDIISKKKYFVVSNAIDFNKFKYSEQKRKVKRKELNISEETLVVGHVGRFSIEKNHKYLIDVFENIHFLNPNSILVLIGDGDIKKDIETYVQQKKLLNHVLFLGERNDINQLYSMMDIFVFPSFYEGLGIALLEAQISLLPCYASKGVPQMSKISNLIEYFDLTTSPKQIAEKIIKDNHLRKNVKLSDDCKKYDITIWAKEIQEKLEKL